MGLYLPAAMVYLGYINRMSRVVSHLELYDSEDWWTAFTAQVRGVIEDAPVTLETPRHLYLLQNVYIHNEECVVVSYRRATLRDL